MDEAKTTPTKASVAAFVARIKNPEMREDCQALVPIMTAVAQAPPVMWGTSIVGFGAYHYTYASGREGDWPLVAFAPRAKYLVIYVMPGFTGYDDLTKALGPVSHGVSCIYVRRLSDLHLPTLKKLMKASIVHLKKTWGAAR